MKASLPSEVPIGGTSGLDHGGTAAVDDAAAWLAATPYPERPRPIVPAIIARFGLSVVQACEAIGLANRRRP